MTLSITTHSTKGLIVTLSINDTQQKKKLSTTTFCAKFHYSECQNAEYHIYLYLCWMSLCWMSLCWVSYLQELNSLPANVWLGRKCLSVTNKTFNDDILSPIIRRCSSLAIIKYSLQGILKGGVWLYYWPPVWLVRNQLYDNWQFLFLFAKQTNPNQSNRRSMVLWYFPL